MRAGAAIAAVLAVGVAAAPGEARRTSKPHRAAKRHAPPTPRIRPGAAAPFVAAPLPVAVDPGAPAAPAADPTGPPTPPSAPAAPLPHTLGVSAKEFTLTLTRTLVGDRAVTIELRNTGEDGHDLHVDTLGGTPVAAWDELAADAPAVAKTVTLAAGTYRLYCSLPGHAAAGMDTRLTVGAAAG